jgi:hypothetical protein
MREPQNDQVEEGGRSFIAYRLPGAPMRLVPAQVSRVWMDQTKDRFAYRCLPLLLANQSGWLVLSSHQLVAVWNGGDAPSGLRIGYASEAPPYPAVSHFGHGILTWIIPYLFRTSPGYNLLVRGPANYPKEGACPLEGVVETDWSVASFTMNWQLTQANRPVVFAVDEPIAMLMPQRRGELEEFRPEIRNLAADPELERAHRRWAAGRAEFLVDLKAPGSDAAAHGWQKDYFRGRTAEGTPAREHQTRLRLRAFEPTDTDPGDPASP